MAEANEMALLGLVMSLRDMDLEELAGTPAAVDGVRSTRVATPVGTRKGSIYGWSCPLHLRSSSGVN